MGNRDGGLCAAFSAIMALLVAGTMIVTLPCVAMADPLSPARTKTAVASPDPWADHITEAARRFAIPERWIRAVMRAESDHDPHAISPKGAMGLMQIMPATWTELRARYHLGDDPYDPRDNVLAGAAYLSELHDLYGSPGFLAAYNAGPGRYEKHLVTGDPLPAETVAYMAKILPQIDADAAVSYRTADRPARSEWSVAPLFIVRVTAETTGDLSSGQPSDGLFVRRSEQQEARP